MMELHDVQARLPDDHPLMIAWNLYRATPEAENTENWARFVTASHPLDKSADSLLVGQVIIDHPYIGGSLFAAFEAGYKAAGGKV